MFTRSTRGPLTLRELEARDLEDLVHVAADAAEAIYAIAQTLPDVPGDVTTPRFRLLQEWAALVGAVTGIQDGILVGIDACMAQNRGFAAAHRRRFGVSP